MQQFGSLLITQLTPWFLGKSWCQGCNSLVEEDCFHSLTTQGLFAYINSNPPQSYFYYDPGTDNISYVQFQNRSLAFFDESPEPFSKLETASTSPLSQYMRFEPDGHLRVYSEDWEQGYDVLTQYINGGDCGYPTICGNYSICSNGQCICPPPIYGTSYF